LVYAREALVRPFERPDDARRINDNGGLALSRSSSPAMIVARPNAMEANVERVATS
jgi:hypothetical protein